MYTAQSWFFSCYSVFYYRGSPPRTQMNRGKLIVPLLHLSPFISPGWCPTPFFADYTWLILSISSFSMPQDLWTPVPSFHSPCHNCKFSFESLLVSRLSPPPDYKFSDHRGWIVISPEHTERGTVPVSYRHLENICSEWKNIRDQRSLWRTCHNRGLVGAAEKALAGYTYYQLRPLIKCLLFTQ